MQGIDEDEDELDDAENSDDDDGANLVAFTGSGIRNFSLPKPPPSKQANKTGNSDVAQLKQTTSGFAKPDRPKFSSSSSSSSSSSATVVPNTKASPPPPKTLALGDSSGSQDGDPKGHRPLGACLAQKKEVREIEEFETETNVMQLISPAKGFNPLRNKPDKDQSREVKLMAYEMKKNTEETSKSTSLGKIMEERCIQEHHVIEDKKPGPGGRSRYYIAKIHVKHFW